MKASDLTSEGYLNVPGGRVWFGIAGNGSGIPLITLHGGPGSPLEAQANQLQPVHKSENM